MGIPRYKTGETDKVNTAVHSRHTDQLKGSPSSLQTRAIYLQENRRNISAGHGLRQWIFFFLGQPIKRLPAADVGSIDAAIVPFCSRISLVVKKSEEMTTYRVQPPVTGRIDSQVSGAAGPRCGGPQHRIKFASRFLPPDGRLEDGSSLAEP